MKHVKKILATILALSAVVTSVGQVSASKYMSDGSGLIPKTTYELFVSEAGASCKEVEATLNPGPSVDERIMAGGYNQTQKDISGRTTNRADYTNRLTKELKTVGYDCKAFEKLTEKQKRAMYAQVMQIDSLLGKLPEMKNTCSTIADKKSGKCTMSGLNTLYSWRTEKSSKTKYADDQARKELRRDLKKIDSIKAAGISKSFMKWLAVSNYYYVIRESSAFSEVRMKDVKYEYNSYVDDSIENILRTPGNWSTPQNGLTGPLEIDNSLYNVLNEPTK